MSQSKKRICIMGGGSSGVTAAKQCLDEGLEPVILERSDLIGGLWAYRPEDVEGLPSVMKTTVINTSKEMSAFSEYPPPAEYANFMHNKFMWQYVRDYADHFGVTKYVRFNKMVEKAEPAPDYDATGRWTVTTRDTKDNSVTEEVFDAVMVCVGHHVFPSVPKLPGQEKFKGKIVHTHSLKTVEGFEDQRVCVVGIGNSAVDACIDLSSVTNTVYLSTRRGSWIIRRLGACGMPYDLSFNCRINQTIKNFLPEWLVNWYFETLINVVCCDHEQYGLKPKHRFNAQHPTLNDALPNRIINGIVKVRGDIKTLTEDGAIFEGDTEVTPLDSIILATGYQIRYPFLSDKLMPVNNNQVDLYRLVWPPHHRHPTLCMIGLIQPLGAIFPIAEMQSRWAALVFSGKKKLPSETEMREEIQERRMKLQKRYVASPRHTIQVDFLPYMDELADEVGCRPDFKNMLLTDPQLFYKLYFKTSLNYQYRLQGPHRWSGARQAVMSAEERIMAPFKKSRSSVRGKGDHSTMHMAFALVALAVMLYMLLDFIF